MGNQQGLLGLLLAVESRNSAEKLGSTQRLCEKGGETACMRAAQQGQRSWVATTCLVSPACASRQGRGQG